MHAHKTNMKRARRSRSPSREVERDLRARFRPVHVLCTLLFWLSSCTTPPPPIPADIRIVRNLREWPVESWTQLETDLRHGQKMILIGCDPFAARVSNGES